MKTFLSKFLGYSLALCVSASVVLAATPAAMLYSSGNFALNGSVGPQSSAIMPGDLIQTRDASVSITSTGNSVLIGPNSAVTYGNDAIQFADGSAVISTSSSMAAEVRGVTVAPAKSAGTYRLTREGDRVMIAALKGSVLLREGSETRTVAEGRTASLPAPVPQAVPGAQTSGGRPSKKLGLAIGSAALVTTGVLIFTEIGENKPVSPVLP